MGDINFDKPPTSSTFFNHRMIPNDWIPSRISYHGCFTTKLWPNDLDDLGFPWVTLW